MIIKLSGYRGPYRIVSLAKDSESILKFEEEKLPYMTKDGKKATIFPYNFSFDLTLEEADQLDNCSSYDVFEIDDHGAAYKCFDNQSADNAIIVTNKCNSNCIMCPTSELIRRKDTISDICRLLEMCSHFPKDAPHITITGGEPFLIKKDIFHLFDYLKTEFTDTDFLLLTNGRAFASEEYANLLLDNSPNHLITGIPIHGHTPELHDYITQSSGSFNQTVRGVKHLISKGMDVELRIVVSRINADHIEKIAQMISKDMHEAYCVKIMAMEMTGNAARNSSSVWIDYADAFKKAKKAIDILVGSGINVGLYNFPLCTVERSYWNICEKSISENKIRFAPQCEICSVKDACGGVFSGTIRLLKESLNPV